MFDENGKKIAANNYALLSGHTFLTLIYSARTLVSSASCTSEHVFDQATAEDVVLGNLKCFVFCIVYLLCVVPPKLA